MISPLSRDCETIYYTLAQNQSDQSVWVKSRPMTTKSCPNYEKLIIFTKRSTYLTSSKNCPKTCQKMSDLGQKLLLLALKVTQMAIWSHCSESNFTLKAVLLKKLIFLSLPGNFFLIKMNFERLSKWLLLEKKFEIECLCKWEDVRKKESVCVIMSHRERDKSSVTN